MSDWVSDFQALLKCHFYQWNEIKHYNNYACFAVIVKAGLMQILLVIFCKQQVQYKNKVFVFLIQEFYFWQILDLFSIFCENLGLLFVSFMTNKSSIYFPQFSVVLKFLLSKDNIILWKKCI
jgi:hypothetical protein